MAADLLTVSVIVAGEPLEQKRLPDGRLIVGTPFDASTTFQQPEEETNRYGETYTQSWPVTPYSIRVEYRGGESLASPLSAQVKVFVDGKLAGIEYLGGDYASTYEFKGFGANPTKFISRKDQVTEFLFCLPRPRAAHVDAMPTTIDELAALKKANAEAGTIRVEARQASFFGESTLTSTPYSSSSSVDAIGKNAAKAARITAASSSGRAITGGAVAYRGPSVSIGEHIKTKTLHYATTAT